jgi:fibronectin type 3 domain-containing protein
VTASDGTSTEHVLVTWGAVTGATGYEVLRSVSGGDPSVIGTSATPSYIDTTASPGVTYSYWVRATGLPSGNASDLSDSDTGYVGLSAPGSVSASDGTSTAHVLVTWGAVPGATGYKVIRTLNDGPSIEVATVGSGTLSFSDAHTGQSTAPQYGQIYSYTVRAVYGPGPGVTSASDTGYLRVLAPVDVQASDGTSVSHVTVTWAVTPGASAYQVFRAQGSSALSMIGTVEGVNAFDDEDTLPGVAYDYAVKAIGNPLANISEFSALDGGHRKLAAPASLLATDGGSQQHVELTWSATPGATEYEVLRGTSPESLAQLAVIGNVTQYLDATAPPGAILHYAVRGRSVTGAGETSAVDTGYRGLIAPTNVQATDGTIAAHVSVTWTAVGGASGYRVLRAASGGGAVEVGSVSGGSVTTFADVYSDAVTSPQYGQVYSYSVRAISEAGLGPASAANDGHLKMAVPGSFSASDGTVPGGVAVTWTASPGATGYQLSRRVGTGSWTQISTPVGDSTAYIDTSAVIGALYSYRIRSVGAPSGNVSEYVTDAGHRGLIAPSNLSATDGTLTDRVRVAWTQVPGATGYKVLRGTSAESLAQVATRSGATATTFDDTGAPSGVTLFYAVRAVTGAGDTELSQVDTGYRGIAAPANVQASDGTSAAQVNVTWGAVAGATGYRVLRAVGSGTPIEVGSVSGGSTLSFADAFSDAGSSPQYGQVYSYRVQALSAAGPGASSAANAGHLKLLAPTGVSATDGTSGSGVVVTWAASPGATGYRVLRAEGSAAPAQIGTTTVALTFTDATAVPGRVYSYTARATGNPSGNISDPSAADTGYRGLGAPVNVQASDGTSAAHVAVTWTAATGATGYEVLRAAVSGTPTVVGSSATTAFNDTTASASTVYQYSVRSTGPAGVAASIASASNAGHLRMAAPVGVVAADGTVAGGVTVTWTASPGATDYQVFRAVGTATPTQVGTSAGATSYTDSTAVIGTLYSYRIRSVGAPSGNVSDLSAADSGYRTLVAPGGVSASDGTFTNRVTVTWSQLPGATGYKVLRGTAADALAQVGTTSGAAATTFNDTAAPAGVTLFYAVRAVTAAGDGPASATDTGYRGVAAPTNVQASDGTSAVQVNVTWGAVAGATGYRVLRAVGSGTPIEVGSVEGSSTLTFADVFSDAGTSPQYGQVYSYTVRATSVVGPGVVSSANAGHLKLRAPIGVSAADGASGANVVVTWMGSPGATGYRVLRAEGSAAPAQIGTTTGALTFTDATAVPGRMYSYTARATGNPSGNVSDSSAADTGYRGLGAPVNVQASDGTSAAHVRVTWTAATGAVSYKVFRDGSETPLQSGITGAAFNDTSAVPGVSYTYAVRAVAAAGDSPLSGSNAGYRQMSAPANVQASDGTLTTGISLTWNAVPGAVSYQVFRNGTSAAIGTTTDVAFADTAVGAGLPLPGTAYTYTVRAVGAAAGAVSPASAGNAGYRSLGAPTGVAASDGASTANVAVSWTGVTGATGYRIFRAPVGSSVQPTVVGNVGGAGRTFNDTTATPGTWFTYSVAATTSAGPSMPSEPDNGHRALSVPGNVQATDGTSTAHVRVSWAVSAGAGSYEVFRRIGSGNDEQVGAVNAPALLYDDTSAVPGVSYSYSVRAVGATPPEGLVQPISAKSAVNAGYRQMPVPAGVLAGDGTSTAQVTVSWNAVPGAVSYRVFRGTTSIATGIVGTSFEDGSAAQGTRFSYTVRAVGAASGALSAASAADFGYRNRPGPTNVQATDTDLAKVRITWTLAASGSPAVTGYEVRRIEDGVGAVTLTSTPLGATATSFDDVTATPGTTYTYEVRARYRLTGTSPAQFVLTLPGADTGTRPSAFGSGEGGLAGEDGDGQSGEGEGGVASAETGGSAESPGSAVGGEVAGDPSRKASGSSDADPDAGAGDESAATLSCHDVIAGLLARIMELEDEIAELPEADVSGGESRHALLAVLRSLLDPISDETPADTEDADQPETRVPKACIMAAGDVNLDGTVDGRDIADFMDAWAAGDEAVADINRDGFMTSADLYQLLRILR